MSQAEQKSRSDIEELKRDWNGDPSWDLEETAGFEAHREELAIYSRMVRRARDEQALRDQVETQAYLGKIGCRDNPALGLELKELRQTLAQVVTQLAAREGLS